jgi:hypothetical protein
MRQVDPLQPRQQSFGIAVFLKAQRRRVDAYGRCGRSMPEQRIERLVQHPVIDEAHRLVRLHQRDELGRRHDA